MTGTHRDGGALHCPTVNTGPEPHSLWHRTRVTREKLLRYAGVSVVSVVVTQSLLLFLKGGLGWTGVGANLVAVSVAALPAYLLNRRWVWGVTGSHSWSREVTPFWVYTLMGLVVSTVFVGVADDRWGTTVAVSAANLTAFGVLWVGKFLMMDRILFASGDRGVTPVTVRVRG